MCQQHALHDVIELRMFERINSKFYRVLLISFMLFNFKEEVVAGACIVAEASRQTLDGRNSAQKSLTT